MPLSSEVVSENIKELINKYPQKQAVAIALEKARSDALDNPVMLSKYAFEFRRQGYDISTANKLAKEMIEKSIEDAVDKEMMAMGGKKKLMDQFSWMEKNGSKMEKSEMDSPGLADETFAGGDLAAGALETSKEAGNNDGHSSNSDRKIQAEKIRNDYLASKSR